MARVDVNVMVVRWVWADVVGMVWFRNGCYESGLIGRI